MLSRLFSFARTLLRRRRVEDDVQEELRFHLESYAADLERSGLPAAAARRRAHIEFGLIDDVREAARAARGQRPVEAMRQIGADVYFAIRALRRSPSFTLTTLLTLTLGIGANAAIFSMVNAVLLKPLSVRSPEQLVLFADDVSQGTVGGNPFPEGRWTLFSREAFDFLRVQAPLFTSIAAFESGDYSGSLAIPGRQTDTSRIDVDFVSGNYFDTLGATPLLGRMLTNADDQSDAPAIAVASERFWRDRLDADEKVVGRTVVIDSVPLTIVGVMPRSFFGVRVAQSPEVWVPLSRRDGALRDRRDRYWLSLIGRLEDNATIEDAEVATTTRLRQFLASHASTVDDAMRRRIDTVSVTMVTGARGISVARAQHADLLVILLAAVGAILLIACANVGTLMLARAASREHDQAVRRALGASRGRLIRQWLTESLLLGGLGAICGVTVAALVAPGLLAAVVPNTVPMEATIDPTVLAFTALVTVVACLIFGLAPSLNAGQVDPKRSLRLSGSGRPRGRAFGLTEPFIVVQIAMSLVLVVAATLLIRTFLNLQSAPFGFNQDRVLLVAIDPRPAGYRADTVAGLYRQIHERLNTVPGVEAVTFARYSPFSGYHSTNNATVDGDASAPVRLEFILAGPDYTHTLGMPLVAGRAFTFEDNISAPRVAMVNEALASHYFSGRTPIGHRINDYEIVGVVKDAHFREPRAAVSPSLFIPMLQERSGRVLDCEFEVRTHSDADAMAAVIRQTIAEVEPKLAIGRTRTLQAQVQATFGAERAAAQFIGTFALLALLVAAVGLYGLVSHGLARRTRELGIRVALGATRTGIVRLVARENAIRLAAGLSIGLIVAQLANRVLANQLFGIAPSDVASAIIAAGVLAAVTVLATLRPTLRATRIDPVTVLRDE